MGAPQEAQWVYDEIAHLSAEDAHKKAQSILQQRKENTPLAYILGKWNFRGLDYCVGPGVLIPRPETEELVDLALKAPKKKSLRVIDLGSGTGVLGISYALEAVSLGVDSVELYLVERSLDAFQYLKKNVDKHLISSEKIKFKIFNLDWNNISKIDFNNFDILFSNPPYVSEEEYRLLDRGVADFEPKEALLPSHNSWQAYVEILGMLDFLLAPGGRAYFEFGPAQDEEGWKRLIPAPYSGQIYKDLSGHPRMLEVFDTQAKSS